MLGLSLDTLFVLDFVFTKRAKRPHSALHNHYHPYHHHLHDSLPLLLSYAITFAVVVATTYTHTHTHTHVRLLELPTRQPISGVEGETTAARSSFKDKAYGRNHRRSCGRAALLWRELRAGM